MAFATAINYTFGTTKLAIFDLEVRLHRTRYKSQKSLQLQEEIVVLMPAFYRTVAFLQIGDVMKMSVCRSWSYSVTLCVEIMGFAANAKKEEDNLSALINEQRYAGPRATVKYETSIDFNEP